ncbi:hypothetical protein IKX64_00025 [Candidatus Saccharibacteria bacterium]|nr:hypothetical protein [Candidatus Saccharibacteria bacterium]
MKETTKKTRFKKLRACLLVVFAFALVVFGTIGSTISANASEETDKAWNAWESEQKARFEAKYLLKMLARCALATGEATGNDRVDAMTLKGAINNGAWESYKGKTLKYFSEYDNEPHADAFSGRGHNSCYATFNGKGLIAATINALKKIGITYQSKSWDESNTEERARLLCDMGFSVWTQQDRNMSVNDKLGENRECADEMVNALKSNNKKISDKDQLFLVFNTVNDSYKEAANWLIETLWYEYMGEINPFSSQTVSFTDEITYYYYTHLNGFINGCSASYNLQTTKPNSSYTVIEVPKPLSIPGENSIKLVTHYSTLNGDGIENFHAEAWTPDYSLTKDYSGGALKVSCTDGTYKEQFNNLSKEYMRLLLINSGIVDECVAAYKTNYNNFSKTMSTNYSDALETARESVKTELKFKNSSTQARYATMYGQTMSQDPSSTTARYYANKAVMEEYKNEIGFDDLNAKALKPISLTGPEEGYTGQYGCYGLAKTDLEKYKCNAELISTSTKIRQDDAFAEIQSAMVAVAPVYELEAAEDAISRLGTLYDSFKNNKDSLKDPEEVKNTFYSTRIVDSVRPSLSALNVFASGNDLSYFGKEGNYNYNAPIFYDGSEYSCKQAEYLKNTENLEKSFNQSASNILSDLGMAFSGTTTNMEDDPENGDLSTHERDGQLLAEYGNGNSTPTCEGTAVMGWVLCKVTQIATDGARWLYENAVEQSLQLDAGELAANNEGAHQAWSYFVSFANIILVILFLFVIFSQLTGFGIDNYGIKRVLPKLIIVAILINLSFIICQLVVDATNILGHSFESLFDGITVSQNTSVDKTSVLDATLSGLFAAAGLTLGGIGVAFIVKERKSLLTGLLLPILLVVLVAFIAVLFFFILLGVRKAGILALVVISPVAIVCYALPNTKKYFDKWKNGLKSLLIVYPVCGLMLGMSRFVARLVTAGGSDFISSLVATAVLAYPFFVIPTLISKSISAVTSLGDKVSQLGRGLRRKTSDGVKNTAAYQQAQKRREEAKAQRMNRRMRDMTEGKGIGGKLFGGQYKKQADKQKALNDRIAAIQAAAAKDKRAVTAEEQAEIDSIKEEKRKNAERWIARGGLSVEEAAARAKAEDDKIKARVAFEEKSEKGSTTEAVINLAGIQATNAAYMDLARATEPPKEIDFATATQRADSAHQSEEYKGFSEQFSQLDKGGLKNAAINALRKLSVENGGDTNEAQAAIDLLKKGGFTQETLEAFDEALGGDALKNDTKRQSLISILGSSGNILMKGYSKYLAEAGADAVSFKQWMQNGDSNLVTNALANMKLEDYGGDVEAFNKAKHDRRQKLETLTSLKAYKEATFTNDDMLANADKDTIKFLNAKAQKDELGGAVSKADLARASVSKSGEELTAVNKGIETSLNNVKIEGSDGMTIKRTFTYDANGNVTGTLYAQYDKTGAKVADVDEAAYLDAFKNSVAEFGFSNESFGKLEKSTWNALTNGNTALKEAFGEQYGDQIMAVRKDKRIWNKISKEMQDELIKSLPEKMKQELENWEKTQRGASQDSDQNQDQN